MTNKSASEKPNVVATVINGKIVYYTVSDETLARWERDAEARRSSRKNWR